MNTKMFLVLIVYGSLLCALSVLPQWIEPDIAKDAFVFGALGGGICVLWGMLGLFGFRHRIWVTLTLVPIIFVLLSQAVTRWMPSSGDKPASLLLTVLITVMLGATMGLFVWIMPHEEYGPPSAAGAQKKLDAAGSTRKSA